jgi:hypothetical protein
VLFKPDVPHAPPCRQHVYWVPTWILEGRRDPKQARPAVVVRVPSANWPYVLVVTRTTRLDAAGVQHPADQTLGLEVPGVWELVTLTAKAHLWSPDRGVEHRGPLDDRTFIARLKGSKRTP